jgi:catechol 2,3-dioxygenase-like lactoylglutathione lyase family enzyme
MHLTVLIVADATATLSFYQDMLGFEVTFRGPTPEDEFFGMGPP